MIGFYNYTVILTYIGLVSTFIGITQVFEENFMQAIFCLILSGVCDMFDGVVARTHKGRSEHAKKFGIQIDSLCDVICFGVFPAIINYAFTRITDKDAEQLLDRLCLKNMFPLDKESKRIIINNSRGIPRQITNLFDFVKNGQYKSETLASFLGVISETDFINLLESMSSDDMFLYTNTLDQYMKTYSLDAFIEQLKDFILRVVFLMEGNIADGFEETDISRLRNIFRNIDITKVATIISNISNHTSEADFKFAMLKLRQLMHNKNISNIVNENAITAVTQSGKAKQLSSEISHYKKVEQNENAMKPLNVAYLNQFGGDA